MLQVRLATPDDLEEILDLIDDASRWLTTKNTDQWSSPWPNRGERDARVLRGLLSGRTWLVQDYGIPVATVTFRPEPNLDLWNAREARVPAAYMSRLVLNREYAGMHIGATLTDWAGARGRSEFGAESLRIDVWTTNISLHSYYEKRGFHFLRFCSDDKYPSAALFYKPTADIDDSARSQFWEIHAIPPPSPRLAGEQRSSRIARGSSACESVAHLQTQDAALRRLHAIRNRVMFRRLTVACGRARFWRRRALRSEEHVRESASRHHGAVSSARVTRGAGRRLGTRRRATNLQVGLMATAISLCLSGIGRLFR
jgi:ribosomal protein S18 acetylase RimI-like enzyme